MIQYQKNADAVTPGLPRFSRQASIALISRPHRHRPRHYFMMMLDYFVIFLLIKKMIFADARIIAATAGRQQTPFLSLGFCRHYHSHFFHLSLARDEMVMCASFYHLIDAFDGFHGSLISRFRHKYNYLAFTSRRNAMPIRSLFFASRPLRPAMSRRTRHATAAPMAR